MTEIPEHLLKRSRERRAAMGGGDDASGGADAGPSAEGAAGSSTPAKATASAPAAMPAHPAPAEPPAAPPPSPMVEAYQRRRKIPFWAMPVLAVLPVWAYVYAGTLSPPPADEGGPAVIGEELYGANGCAGCHGASGGGGSGPAFAGGSIYETWPNFVDHFRWVRLGSQGWQAEVGDTYGANDKPVSGGMPGFGEDSLSDADLLFIVLHERHLGGENPNEEDAARLELAAEIFAENPEMTLEEVMEQVDAELPPGETEGGAIEGQGDPELENDDAAEEDPELG